ncbi:hypothetical protein V493_07923 [Pseudogymnoascus sp. VKM F-4281 (FW-2241)]|nr:hypothetical protein V493_07923 [Pseudogymnoascus sp. VKM F-4281 (FW-2241)]
MHTESPLEKSYDRKCVPVRRVSSWEREQIEKRQKHLKEFKGQKWQKLHREDEIRKIKAAADGIRYKREPPPPTPITAQLLKFFTMEERRRRKGTSTEKSDLAEIIITKLYKSIKGDPPSSNILRYQIRLIEKFREKSPPQPTNPTLDRAEKELFQLIKQKRDLSDIRLKLKEVEEIEAAVTPTPVPAEDNTRKRNKPAETKLGQEAAATGRSEAPIPTSKNAPERSKPSKPDHGYGRESTDSSAALVPADGDIIERRLPTQAEHGSRHEDRRCEALLDDLARYDQPPNSQAYASSDLPLPPRHHKQSVPTPKPNVPEPKPAPIPRQKNNRAEETAEASTRGDRPSKSKASAPSISGPLVAPSPPRRAGQPSLPFKLQRQENTRPSTAPESSTPHPKRPQSNASTSSFGGRFVDPPPAHRARQPIPPPRPSKPQRQQTARPRTAPEPGARTHQRPQSSASVSSRASTFAIPASPPRGRQRARSSASPPPPKRRRAVKPSNTAAYLSDDSPSPPPPRAPGIPPRPRFKALTSITDKEDRASRALMHPASAPLAKLSVAEKVTDDFAKVGGMQRAC